MRELDDAACLIPGCKRCLGHGATGVTSGSASVVTGRAFWERLAKEVRVESAPVVDHALRGVDSLQKMIMLQMAMKLR